MLFKNFIVNKKINTKITVAMTSMLSYTRSQQVHSFYFFYFFC